MDKAELIITALQQRIGELTSSYELQIAGIRAEYTELIEKLKEYEDNSKAKEDYSKEIEELIK